MEPANEAGPLRERLGDFPVRSLPSEGRARAAVAAVLCADACGGMSFLLTRRSRTLRRHRGQWALPGGRMDPGETPEETALRELSEELGLTLPPLCVAGRLDDFATRSGFVVTPVVVLAEGPIECVPDPAEVAEVHRVPLALLDRPDCPRLVPIPESERPVLSIPIHGSWVHAPTAAIVYQLFEAAYRGRVVRVAHVEQPVFAWR